MFAKLSTICFITGKVQREREARTSPPAADPAGIRVIRERARTDLTRKGKEQILDQSIVIHTFS